MKFRPKVLAIVMTIMLLIFANPVLAEDPAIDSLSSTTISMIQADNVENLDVSTTDKEQLFNDIGRFRTSANVGQADPPKAIVQAGTSVDETEPNDGFATADPISFDDIAYGTFANTEDVDVYRVTISTARRFMLVGGWVGEIANSGLENNMLFGLFNSSQELVTASGYLQFDDGSAVQALEADLVPGTYYIATFINSNSPATYVGDWYGFSMDMADLSVIYNGNGNTGGTIPVDSAKYWPGEDVTVLGNSGGLAKTGTAFVRWNTLPNGTGTDYAAGSTLTLDSSNVTLYAKWADTQLIQAFVTRFYNLCLLRAPDAEGLNFWTANLVNQVQTGADVGLGFIFSDEFVARNVSDDEYLNIMYQAFFNRAPDTEGKSFWLSSLGSGTTRLQVLAGFVNSNEFTTLCSSYGITRGTIDPTQPIDPDAAINDFVTRFYQECLNREPDTDGLNFWSSTLKSGSQTGANLSKEFIFSDEFIARSVTNDQYLDIMYNAFFNRAADTDGKNFWLNSIASGTNRLEVMAGFVNSPEFSNLCSSYGITAGTVSTTPQLVNCQVFINNVNVTSGYSFYEYGRVVLGPVRVIADSMGLTTTWNASTQQITFTSGNKNLVMTVGSTTYTFDGTQYTSAVPPRVLSGITCVPMKTVVEAFGGTIRFE